MFKPILYFGNDKKNEILLFLREPKKSFIQNET